MCVPPVQPRPRTRRGNYAIGDLTGVLRKFCQAAVQIVRSLMTSIRMTPASELKSQRSLNNDCFVHFVDGPRLLPPFADSLSVVLGVCFAFDLSDGAQVLLQTLSLRRFWRSGMSWRLPCADGKIRAQGPTASRLNRRGPLQHVIGRRRDCHESRTSQTSSDAAPMKAYGTVAHMSGRGGFLPAKMAASSCLMSSRSPA